MQSYKCSLKNENEPFNSIEEYDTLITKETSMDKNEIENESKNEPNLNFLSNYQISIPPLLYFFSNLIELFFSLIMNLFSQYRMFSSNSNYSFSIPNYFFLIKTQNLIYCINSYFSALCFFIVLITFYFEIKQRLKVPEYQSQNYHNYILLIIGIIFCILKIFEGSLLFIQKWMEICNENLFIIQVGLFNLLNVFTICYGVYVFFFMKMISSSNNTFGISYGNWLKYYFGTVLLLTSIWILFIFMDIESSEVKESLTTNELFQESSKFSMYYILPYFIHLIGLISIACNYFPMQYLNYALKQNMNMDFLYIGVKE